MKKIIALFFFMAALLPPLAGCKEEEPLFTNIVFIAQIEEVYEDALLVSTSDDVSFDKASVRFAEEVFVDFTPAVGQTVRLIILPQIAESYPVQVTAVAIELIVDPTPSDLNDTEYPVSFYRADSHAEGGWGFMVDRAENAAMMLVSSVRHIPVCLFSDAASLETFLEEGGAYFQFEFAYNGAEKFSDVGQKYDDAFFLDHQLLLLYTLESSGSIRHKIEDISISGNTLSVVVNDIVPEEGKTDDMAEWFIVIEFSNAELTGCDKFDAYYA